MTSRLASRVLSDDPSALRDVREGGEWSLTQRAKNDTLFAMARAGLLLTHLPEGVLVRLGAGLGWLIHRLSPGLRSLAITQLARALPGADAHALAKRNFIDLGITLGRTAASLRASKERVLPFAKRDRAVLDEALALGRGVVLASAHLGPFEEVATTLAAAVPFVVVARESYDPRLGHVYRRLRRYDTVYRGAPGAGMRMMRVLRRGAVLGIPMDLRTRAPSVDVPFLGAHAPTAIGPARIALRARSPVVVATVGPAGQRSPDHASDPPLAVTVTRIPTDDLDASDAGIEALTARINAELETRILAVPTLWPWMHRRA